MEPAPSESEQRRNKDSRIELNEPKKKLFLKKKFEKLAKAMNLKGKLSKLTRSERGIVY